MDASRPSNKSPQIHANTPPTSTALVAQNSTPLLSQPVFSSSVQLHHKSSIVVDERPRALAMESRLVYIQIYQALRMNQWKNLNTTQLKASSVLFLISIGRRDVLCASCLLTRLTERQASAAAYHFRTSRTVQQTLLEKSLSLN